MLKRVALSGLLLVTSVQFALAQAISADEKAEVVASINKTITERAFLPGVDFGKWPSYLAKQQDAIDNAEQISSFSAAINKALHEFGFSHIRLQAPRATTSGSGQLLSWIECQTAPPKDGTPNNSQFVTSTKEKLTWVGDDAAVLRIFTFSTPYDRANVEKLCDDASKAKYLILDLRSNGGGASNNLNHLLSLLLPSGSEYGTFISRRMVDQFKVANPDSPIDPIAIAKWSPNKAKTRARSVPPFKGKIAVLLNRGSASASEITAAALREVAGAKLVGTKSAGAVLASTFVNLPVGFRLQIPVSDYVTIKGVRLEANPLVPDVEFNAPRRADGSDPVVDKAIEALKS